MSESKFDLSNYPNLIAIPYAKTLVEIDPNTNKPTEKIDPQRKDHQRICLEMILAFNASICLANYYYYKTVEAGEDNKSQKEALFLVMYERGIPSHFHGRWLDGVSPHR